MKEMMKDTIVAVNFRRLKKAILIAIFLLTSSVYSFSQISLSMDKTTLGKVIESIKKQSSYQFFYEDRMSSIPVDKTDFKDKSVDEVLRQVLAGKGISYTIEDGVVYLSFTTPSKTNTQKKTVSGQIQDKMGEPLIGASVMILGTSLGTVTDIDGKYSLTVPSDDAQLQITYLGYHQEVVAVKGKSSINIVLREDSKMIDEVVVTALGIKRDKKMLGYAIQELKADEMNQTGNPSISGFLQGKTAGVQINTSPTGLNGSAKITIRGNSSLTDNNQPLWVVDGVPFNDNSDSKVSLYGGIDRGGAAVDINPEDIESVSVLKGPNAAALYGSRAGNGVILVTTKKGVAKKGFGVTYSTNLTWTKVSDTLDKQTIYGQGMDGVYDSSTPFSFGGKLDGHQTPNWWNDESSGSIPYSNSGNKIKKYFDTGFSQNHNVAFGNVTETSNYRASFGYLDSKGLFKDEKLEKYNLDFTSGMKMNKYLSSDTKISLSRTKANNRPFIGKQGEMYQLLFLPNNIRLSDLQAHSIKQEEYQVNGQLYDLHNNWFGPTQDILNPYFVAQQRTNMDDRWRAFGYQTLKLDFTDWLHASGKLAFDYYSTKIEETDKSQSRTLDEVRKADKYTKASDQFFELNTEFMIYGNNSIGDKIRIDYTFGGNMMRQKNESLSASAVEMAIKGQWHLNSAGLETKKEGGIPSWANEYIWKRQTNSLFGSIQFAYNEYVALDVTGRNDWSSTLPKDNNSYFYPSVNLSFIGSEFINKQGWTLPSAISFAKVRLSYAMLGKDTKPYNTNNYANWNQGPNGPINTQSNIFANKDLKPEMSTSYEVGLDMKFFKNRLGFDFTYYNSMTKDQIMNIPQSSGSGNFLWKTINAGRILNRGVEFSLYSTPIQTKDLEFGLDVNVAHNSSTVKKLIDNYTKINFSDDKFFFSVGAEEGGKLGDIYTNKTFERDDKGNLILRAGMPTLKSLKNKKKIGNIQPKMLMSISPRFSYKDFSFSSLIDMRFGGQIVSVSEAIATHYGTAARTADRNETVVLPGVDLAGNPNTTPILKQDYYKMIGAPGDDNGSAEDFVYSASYVNLREIALSYNLPRKLLNKSPLTTLRFSLIARNIAYLKKHTPGTSPEGGFDTTMYSQAFDYAAIPSTRTFGFSINVGF